MSFSQYNDSLREIKDKAPAIIARSPGLSVDSLAGKLGFGRASSRYKHLKQVLPTIAQVVEPKFAKYNSGESAQVYPLGYKIPEIAPRVAPREVPCKVYREGDPDYERILKETYSRKSA